MIVTQYKVSLWLVHAHGDFPKAHAWPYLSHLHSGQQSLGDAAWLVLQAGLAVMRPASLKVSHVPAPTRPPSIVHAPGA